jgi:hypothetical protein
MKEPNIPEASVGYDVTFNQKPKWRYCGELLKPWTWLKFERVRVIKRMATDHVAIVGKPPYWRDEWHYPCTHWWIEHSSSDASKDFQEHESILREFKCCDDFEAYLWAHIPDFEHICLNSTKQSIYDGAALLLKVRSESK